MPLIKTDRAFEVNGRTQLEDGIVEIDNNLRGRVSGNRSPGQALTVSAVAVLVLGILPGVVFNWLTVTSLMLGVR